MKSPPLSQRSPGGKRQLVPGRWSNLLYFLLGALAATALYFAFSPIKSHFVSEHAAPVASHSGPWGQLEYTSIILERPEESQPEKIPAPQPIHWNFENFSEPELEQFIKTADLTAAQQNLLLDKSRWKDMTNGWQILPPLELVRDMSLAARKKIYFTLRRSPSNDYLHTPLRIPAERFERWLTDTELPKEKIKLLREIVIPEEDVLCFYDGLLMEWLCSPEEKKNLARAISQTSALVVKLRVNPDSDLNALEKYWARGARGRLMRPFLESLVRVPGGTAVNISLFFPTFARLRLYTYPDKTKAMAARKDCFYTAMNFFNEAPDYRFLNSDAIQTALNQDYTQVQSDWTFGDVILLKDTNNFAVHMCVYIADQVVFTKNGANLISPWVLMRMSDMLREYRSEKDLTVVVYRKKSV